MGRVTGSVRLPLPHSLAVGLAALGFQDFQVPGVAPNRGPYTFTLVRRPQYTIQIVPSNLPGESAVIASWPGHAAERIEIDPLLRILEADIRQVLSPSQAVAAILAELGRTP